MNCKKCGAQLTPEDVFCNNCGEKVEVSQEPKPISEDVANTPSQEEGGTIENKAPEPTVIKEINDNNVTQEPVYNTTTNNNQPKKMDTTKIILIVVLIIAVIIIVFLLTRKTNNTTPTPSDDSSTPTATQISNTYKINVSSYEFSIPNDLLVSTSGGVQLVTDNTTWAASIEVMTKAEAGVTYADVKAGVDKMAELLKEKGHSVKTKGVEKHGSVEMVYFDVVANDSFTLVYYELPQSGLGVSQLFTATNSIDHTYLDKLAGIVSTAKYVGTTNNMKIDKAVIMKDTLKSLK